MTGIERSQHLVDRMEENAADDLSAARTALDEVAKIVHVHIDIV